jgi:hypothetical protein
MDASWTSVDLPRPGTAYDWSAVVLGGCRQTDASEGSHENVERQQRGTEGR